MPIQTLRQPHFADPGGGKGRSARALPHALRFEGPRLSGKNLVH
jgi:hypothetical protein